MQRRSPMQQARAAVNKSGGHVAADHGDTWEGSPASATHDVQSDWPPLVPLAIVPQVSPFPLEILPARLRDLAMEISTAVNCPLDFPAVTMLNLSGGAIANARHLSLKNGHSQAPCLYVALVGSPGSGKSPVLKMLRRPFDDRQAALFREWQDAHSAWNHQEADQRGPRPVASRISVSDVTTECLASILAENPRGVNMTRDELMELVASMNQYKGGKGQDRQVYLKLWSGESIIIDRKSDRAQGGGALFVNNAFVSIVGGIQPDVLGEFRGGRYVNDGHLDRWLFCCPRELPAAGETWCEVRPESMATWDDVVSQLLALEMVAESDGPRPKFVHLTTEARKVWQAFTDALAEAINDPDLPNTLKGPWHKLRGYCGRLALIIHFMRWACDEVKGEDVDGESMTRAVRLIDYFQSHAKAAYSALEMDPELALARKLVHWLREQQRTRFSIRDAYRALRPSTQKSEDVEPVVALLESHGAIRPVPGAPGTKPGRKASSEYDVHPAL